jgi:hypothetical protein
MVLTAHSNCWTSNLADLFFSASPNRFSGHIGFGSNFLTIRHQKWVLDLLDSRLKICLASVDRYVLINRGQGGAFGGQEPYICLEKKSLLGQVESRDRRTFEQRSRTKCEPNRFDQICTLMLCSAANLEVLRKCRAIDSASTASIPRCAIHPLSSAFP